MAGTAHSSYITEVSYYIKGAEKTENATFISDQINKTIRDFCRETWIYRETLTAINVVDEDDDYTLTPPVTNCDAPEIHMVDWVKFKKDGADDDQYTFLRPWNLESEEVATSTGINAGFVFTEADAPQVYYMDPDDTLWLKPIPNENAAGTGNLLVKLILIPKITATTTPTHIYNDWLETIAFGVASRVMAMAGKKWYNPQLATFYKAEYLRARNEEARAQRWGGKARTQLTVRFHPGYSGGARNAGGGIF